MLEQATARPWELEETANDGILIHGPNQSSLVASTMAGRDSDGRHSAVDVANAELIVFAANSFDALRSIYSRHGLFHRQCPCEFCRVWSRLLVRFRIEQSLRT